MEKVRLAPASDWLKDNALPLTTVGSLTAFGAWSGYKYKEEIENSKQAKLVIAGGASALGLYAIWKALQGPGFHPPWEPTPK